MLTGERNGGAAVPLAETENLGILGKEGVPNGNQCAREGVIGKSRGLAGQPGQQNKHRHEAGRE